MPRPDWLPQSLYPFDTKVFEVDGCRLSYIDVGRGPTLLFIHGNPTWSFLYRNIIRGLMSEFRCVALDLPGFGLSRAPDGFDFRPRSHARVLEQFVVGLDLTGFTIMVQDWGGPIGLFVAARHPDRCAGLIIGNTFAWPARGDRRWERFSSLMGGAFGRLLTRRFNFFVRVVMPQGVRRAKLPSEVMRCYIEPFQTAESRKPTYVFPKEIMASSDFLETVESGLNRISGLPTLIVWGDKDFAFREKERARFESIFRNHTTVTLFGAGHFIQEDAPDEIVRAIQGWWRTAQAKV